jgi:hypothetical protein
VTATTEQLTDVRRRFAHHPPATPRVVSLHEQARAMCGGVAIWVINNTHPSREQSLALTALEEAMFWANAAIARTDPDNHPPASPATQPATQPVNETTKES